ncbi:C10 family peptidase [Flavobacterium geliluteum]|uniref:C10 family peptidase n=1 Tax=Flavobacterium geliluteum TaxID=2816120 RepID=A0A941AY31_9FLAO|nr:C10 family peptidase [Flavobacterium geliluteum]MBP4137277.1 C10 family peptidase [Flavobacterium geliluteum]
MKKYVKYFWLGIIFCFYSCQNSEELAVQNVDANYISIQEATQIAEAQSPPVSNVNGKILGKRKVKKTFSIKTGQENPSMYIINYENNGFVIISGDNRISPILAYSDNNSFPTESSDMPEGIITWMKTIDQTVKKIRKDKKEQSKDLKKLWLSSNHVNVLYRSNTSVVTKTSKGRAPSSADYITEGDCNNGDNMTTLQLSIGQLLQTEWGQGVGYNDLLDTKGCAAALNGRPYTGCVATAVAQVMRYHEYPANYNWNLMNNGGSYETSRLMRDLGYQANLNMNYGCSSSGADRKDIVRTLSNFGYPAANYRNYDYGTVKFEIVYGRPVILCGSEKADFLIFGSKGGHCWVVDGISEMQYYNCVPDPNTPGEVMSQLISTGAYLRMNWGWNGIYNGYYSNGNFNPPGSSYNWRPDMITNIRNP